MRGSVISDEIARHFHSRIIRASEEELDPSQKYIFGYTPHGMFPMGSIYMHNTSQWITLFPNIVPVTLTATITHLAPLLRDISQALGAIEVTRPSFGTALTKFKAVFFVPGGQHEMLLFGETPDEHPVSTKHKGFCQLALQSAGMAPEDPVNVVPVYAYGEYRCIYNCFPVSIDLQRWFVKLLRLNPAFLPVGRFNIPGVPKRTPVLFAVGEPVPVPVVKGIPTEEQVALLHARYYTCLEETFERYKLFADDYHNGHILFEPPLKMKLTQAEFEEAWLKVKDDSKGPFVTKPAKEPLPVMELFVAVFLTSGAFLGPWFVFGDTTFFI